MPYVVNNDKFNRELVTSLAVVMEVSPRTKKVSTPESKLGPGKGVDRGEPKEALVPNTVKLYNPNILRETISEFDADNLADDDITDTEDKVATAVETLHPCCKFCITLKGFLAT